MNNVKKIIGLLVLLPLFTISLTVAGQIKTADAVNVGTVGGTAEHNIGNTNLAGSSTVDDGASGSHKFGSMTTNIVCGDRLCSEHATTFEAKTLEEAKSEISGPYFDLVDVQKTSANSENMFNAIFDVWAGDEHVEDLQLRVISDSETIETMAGSFNAGDHSVTTVKIRAIDPDSISGEIIDYETHAGSENHLGSSVSAKKMNLVSMGNSMIVESKSLDGSYFELFDMTSLGSGLYKVTLTMYAGSEEMQYGYGAIPEFGKVLHVSSDSANKLVYVPRIDANSHKWLSVIIQADDPSTIRIE